MPTNGSLDKMMREEEDKARLGLQVILREIPSALLLLKMFQRRKVFFILVNITVGQWSHTL